MPLLTRSDKYSSDVDKLEQRVQAKFPDHRIALEVSDRNELLLHVVVNDAFTQEEEVVFEEVANYARVVLAAILYQTARL